MPGGNGDGLRLYNDVPIPADECTFGEVRDAAFRDEPRDHRGPPCAPSSFPNEYFAPHVLVDSKLPGAVSSVQAAPGPVPSPPGLQAPIRSVASARRTGQWEGPSG